MDLNRLLNWNVKIGRLFGIPIHLHITLIFFLLPVLRDRGLGIALTLEYVLLVILSILLHELGHALTAKRLGMGGITIMLHGFGGFATSQGYRTPAQALKIVLAGPAVTLVLGLLCWGIGNFGLDRAEPGSGAFLQFVIIDALGRLNLILAALNMLPSLPFDGGHALQALYRRHTNDFRAMRNVAHIGLFVSVPLGVWGFLTKFDYGAFFGFIGFVTSLGTLLQTGGVRPAELFADRRERKEKQTFEKKKKAKEEGYLIDVRDRIKKRDEDERLKKLFGDE